MKTFEQFFATEHETCTKVEHPYSEHSLDSQTAGLAEKLTDRQMESQTDKHIDRQTDSQPGDEAMKGS